MKQPTIDHPTDRPNLTVLTVGPLELTFSYRTVIAFRDGTNPQRVRENDWGPTTGRHLNWCDDGRKAARIPGATFERELEVVLERLELRPAPRLPAGLDVATLARGEWLENATNAALAATNPNRWTPCPECSSPELPARHDYAEHVRREEADHEPTDDELAALAEVLEDRSE